MIECPKCHFVQPDDDFCANCGVNIKVYRQNHQSSALKNWTPYILTFCLVGVLIGFLILQFYNPKGDSSNPIAETQKAQATTVASRTEPTHPQPSASEAPAQQAMPEQAEEQNKMAAVAAQTEEKKADEKFSVETIEVYFLEVPKTTITSMSQEGTVLSDTSSGTVVWFPTAESKSMVLQKGRAITESYRQANPSEVSPLKILYQGGIKKDDEIVYQMQITPRPVDDKRTRIHISGSMKWIVDEGDSKSSTSSSFDSTYAITGPGQLVLTGTVPQGKKPAPETRDVLEKTPLGILNSDNFHKKTSELMIVISIH